MTPPPRNSHLPPRLWVRAPLGLLGVHSSPSGATRPGKQLLSLVPGVLPRKVGISMVPDWDGGWRGRVDTCGQFRWRWASMGT